MGRDGTIGVLEPSVTGGAEDVHPTIGTILRDHVRLSITSFDRLYPGGYVPTLQSSGQVIAFCRDHLGQPIASPALFGPLRERFVRAVHTYPPVPGAADRLCPWPTQGRGGRLAPRRFHHDDGVVFIGVAQEKASALRGRRVHRDQGGSASPSPASRVAVNHYYFYGATSKVA